MASPTTFTFDDLVFNHETNSVSLPSTSRTLLDDLMADIETPFDSISSLDFSLSSDSWHTSICFHFSQLSAIRDNPILLLFHHFHLGQLFHQEELRLLRRQAPSLSRSRRHGRRIHTLFLQTVKHLPGHASHRYYAARRVFVIYSVLGPHAIQVAQNIMPARLRRLSKQDLLTLYQQAKSHSQVNISYPHHLSLFIGMTEL